MTDGCGSSRRRDGTARRAIDVVVLPDGDLLVEERGDPGDDPRREAMRLALEALGVRAEAEFDSWCG